MTTEETTSLSYGVSPISYEYDNQTNRHKCLYKTFFDLPNSKKSTYNCIYDSYTYPELYVDLYSKQPCNYIRCAFVIE